MNTKKTQIQKATIQDIPKLAKVLTMAFNEDPFINWLVKQDTSRQARTTTLFEMFIRHFAIEYGHVYTTDEKNTAVLWVPPKKFDSSILKQLTVLPTLMKVIGMNHLVNRLIGANNIEKYHINEPHYYLMFIGIDPELKGKGIGTMLINHVLDNCDSERIPAYLEATREDLVDYYKRFGFQLKEVIQVVKGGPYMWLMQRR